MKNTALHRIALAILKQAGCERNAYDNDSEKEQIVQDLNDFLQDEKNQNLAKRNSFPYCDIADELIRIGEDFKRKQESRHARYKVIYDGDSFCDGHQSGNNIEKAKDSVFDILLGWMTDQQSEEYRQLKDGTKTQAELDEDWDYMIWNCKAWVSRWNAETNQYEDFWFPSSNELKKIGWVCRNED